MEILINQIAEYSESSQKDEKNVRYETIVRWIE
jgi:hypothetical protein